MGQNALGKSDCSIFKSIVFLKQNDEIACTTQKLKLSIKDFFSFCVGLTLWSFKKNDKN